jgi:dTDP-4-amino-4,6-dideoxygalactose transaminase
MSQELAIDGGPQAVDVDEGDVFSWPIITAEDEAAALEVLRRGAMSDTDVTREFEAEFAEWQGREYALGYSSGTASILGAMYGVGVGVGDEVIAPSVAYWAAALPCLNLGATPVFADVEPDTLCLDPESFRERISEDTAAVVVVHNYGHPADMDPIAEIAADHDVAVIEDVSHAHGGAYRGRRLGNLGDVGAMSMMSRKSFPTGEGGMLLTDDREIYERAVAFGHYSRHEEVLERPGLKQFSGLPLGGQKHRMHQISAAVGRVQLEQYDERMAEIQTAMNHFWDLLDDVAGIHAPGPTTRRAPRAAGTRRRGSTVPRSWTACRCPASPRRCGPRARSVGPAATPRSTPTRCSGRPTSTATANPPASRTPAATCARPRGVSPSRKASRSAVSRRRGSSATGRRSSNSTPAPTGRWHGTTAPSCSHGPHRAVVDHSTIDRPQSWGRRRKR